MSFVKHLGRNNPNLVNSSKEWKMRKNYNSFYKSSKVLAQKSNKDTLRKEN